MINMLCFAKRLDNSISSNTRTIVNLPMENNVTVLDMNLHQSIALSETLEIRRSYDVRFIGFVW